MTRLGGFKATFIALGALVAVLLPALPSLAATAHRLALVIGNNAYADGVLKNPINDARAMSATLRELGFEVRVLENADRMAMQRAVVEFGRKLNENTVGLFYFAGHGMQVRGANYLIPVKAEITSEEEVEVEGLDVAYVMARMATAKNQFNIVILDACRNNPFQRSFRSASNGLAAISAPTGTLIAYATAPGSVASDGDSANGIYTAELVKAIRQPGVSMEEAFKQARSGVIQRTQGRQTPWESSSVIGTFMFRAQPQTASLAAPASRDNSAEVALWNAVKDSRDARDYQAYLDSYPNGIFDRLARVRIAALGDAASSRALPPAGKVQEPKAAVAAPAPAPGVVASLQPPTANLNAVRTPDSDYEAMLKQNWPKVEAALRTHMQAEFGKYRAIMPSNTSTTMPLDLKLEKATLESADPAARKAVIRLAGHRLEGDRLPVWAAFAMPFTYAIDLVDNRIVIGDYHLGTSGPAMVASLQAPAASLNAGGTPTSDYEGLLKRNWPKVEAALKTHMQTDFTKYRLMMPSGQHITTMPVNLKLNKASLQSVDAAARRATILLAGQRQDGSSWAAFNAPFSYALDLVDDRVVIGDYHYMQPSQTQATQ
jgi:uncharacterized caspase-like protein